TRRPGTNGPSMTAWNHFPNSRESLMARQTRARGARSRICFSIALVVVVLMFVLLVGPCRPRPYATQRLHVSGDRPETQPKSCSSVSSRGERSYVGASTPKPRGRGARRGGRGPRWVAPATGA